MSLILRLEKGSALTNEELDNNFVFLNEGINGLLDVTTEITDVAIPEVVSNTNTLLNQKQNINAKLTSLSGVSTNGILCLSGTTITPRSIQSGSVHITINNSDGIAGNPTINLATSSVNEINSIVLRDSSGNFSAGTITANLNGTAAFANEVINGVYTTESYNNPAWITGLAGSKISNIPNASLVNNSITIDGVNVPLGGTFTFDESSIGTSANIADTVVRRNASGNFSAGTITANVVGNVTGNLTGTATLATQVTNGVYTTESYNNPAWITGLAGSKISNIPNSSLANNSITINGNVIPLGGSFSLNDGGIQTNLNTPNTVVKRDGSGNFFANNITSTLTGNVIGNSTSATRLATPVLINGVSFDGSSSITIADNTKLALAGGTVTGSVAVNGSVTSRFVQTVFNNGNVSSSFAADWSKGTIQTLTVTGNITLNVPLNMPSGASLTVFITQDAIGSRVMTPASDFLFFSGNTSLSTAANSVDKLEITRVGNVYYTTLTNQFAPFLSVDTYIVVIDEASVNSDQLASNWAAFRIANPTVRYYLLQPGGNPAELRIPSNYTNDPLSFGPITVNRDNGISGMASNWFNICNLASASTRSRIRLAIDNSGSMTTSTVQASYSLFLQLCKQANLQVETIRMTNENWAAVFN